METSLCLFDVVISLSMGILLFKIKFYLLCDILPDPVELGSAPFYSVVLIV